MQDKQSTLGVAVTPTKTLRQLTDEAYAIVRDVVARGDNDFAGLSHLPDCIYIKNADGVLVFSNDAHQRCFSPGASPIGRTGNAYLDPALAVRAKAIESLILDGCTSIDCEHSGVCPDGSVYRMQAIKRSLQPLGAPGLAVLGLIRLLERDEKAVASKRLDLSASAVLYRDLSERDQEICRLTALGVSSRELGERLGMTTRGIELRKQKAFAKLGVAKAVDLARLLTRLQDRGYLDLGL